MTACSNDNNANDDSNDNDDNNNNDDVDNENVSEGDCEESGDRAVVTKKTMWKRMTTPILTETLSTTKKNQCVGFSANYERMKFQYPLFSSSEGGGGSKKGEILHCIAFYSRGSLMASW